MSINLDNLNLPITVRENLEFRMKLHEWLAKDEGAQKEYIALLKVNPTVFYDTLAWTYNPNLPIGEMNVPFIVSSRPAQIEVVMGLKDAIENRIDVGINKSRKEGATELLMKYISFMMLFYPDVSFLVGSRSEELVDKTGDPSTLFAKIDYTLRFLPVWLSQKLHIERNFKHIKNLDLNSVIDGEATNENFGAGKRVTALILDEFGRVTPSLAQSIADTVRPISDCVIYNSTHWFGPNHAFNKLLQRKGIKKLNLMWFDNPEETEGLYYDYESKEWPRPERSPWYDKEVERSSSRRDVMTNIWANPTGATEQFFDAVMTAKLRGFCKQATYEGGLSFTEEKEKIVNIKFDISAHSKKFKWFGALEKINGELRPSQLHNYIVGADIGFGLGASNSTAEIIDVNTGENVGEYICSDETPQEFGDTITALCKWLGGGTGEAFLIFENNGGQGGLFSKRVISRGLTLVYTKTTEQKKQRKRLNEYGWSSNRKEKEFLLGNLQSALKEGLKEKTTRKFIKIYNELIPDELDGYIFYDTGEINSTEEVDENSSARARHGDRVIALALCVLALQDMEKAINVHVKNPPVGSLAWMMERDRILEGANRNKDWNEPKGLKFSRGW